MSEEIKNETVEEVKAEVKVEETKPAKKMNDKEITVALAEKVDSINDPETKVLAELLLELKKAQDEESNHAKKQMVMSTIASFLSLGLVIIVLLMIMPRVMGLLNNVNTILNSTNQVVAEVESIVENLQKTTDELAAADLTGMMGDVSSLVDSTQVTMTEALGKIMSIDIDSLNGAINDLAGVVAPLSKLFGGR